MLMLLVIVVTINRQSRSAYETKEKYQFDCAKNGSLLPADFLRSNSGNDYVK